MKLGHSRRLALALMGAALLVVAAQVASAAPVQRTLQIRRPGLEPGAIRGPWSTMGPGGARRYAGVFTQTDVSPIAEPLTITNAVLLLNAPGCGSPTLTIVGDSLKIDWPSDCVDPGELIHVRFTADDSATGCGSGEWRDAQHLSLDNAMCSPVPLPGADSRTLAALAGLLAVIGAFAARRRAWAFSPRSVRSRS
jgi:hypothetical protein